MDCKYQQLLLTFTSWNSSIASSLVNPIWYRKSEGMLGKCGFMDGWCEAMIVILGERQTEKKQEKELKLCLALDLQDQGWFELLKTFIFNAHTLNLKSSNQPRGLPHWVIGSTKMAEVSASRISSPSSLVKRLLRLVKQYESAIVRDPSFATKIEVFLKVSAYLIPGSWKLISIVN